MSASNALENAILDHILGGPDYSRLATVYAALYTADPGEGGSANTNEITGTGYARVAVTNNPTNWPAAVSGTKENGTDIQFPMPGAGGWGGGSDATYWGLVATASGGGAILFSAPLTVPQTINEGNDVKFAPGDLIVTAD